MRSFQMAPERTINVEWNQAHLKKFSSCITLGLRNQVGNKFITKYNLAKRLQKLFACGPERKTH